jgi:hypothetical protein
MTRSSYRILNGCQSWQDYVKLDSSTVNDNVDHLNCKQLWAANPIPSKVVYSHASNEACGAILDIHGSSKVFHCNWSNEEKAESSTWRELKAVHLAVQAFKFDLLNRTIA